MTKCHKCDKLYKALIAILAENIRYFECKEKYRGQTFEYPWTEERRKAYVENRINSLKTRKSFIKNFMKEK